MRLKDKHVVITGGTAGIGLATAAKLIEAGARVTICGRSRQRLDVALERLGDQALGWCCDVSDVVDVRALFEHAEAAHGPIDVLVHNAGVQQLMDFCDAQQERAIEREVRVNLLAPMLLTELVLPAMLSRGRGMIVFVTSGLAISPKASAPVYCATKAGLRTFARTLRWQLESTPVRVVEALPPLVDTEMTAGRGASGLSPEEAARQIVAGLVAGRAEVYVGKSRLLRVIPSALANKITKGM